jgi:hypothetical protein
MNAAADLEKLTRAVGDVTSLIAVAADLAEIAEAGDTGQVHVLAAVLRALRVQSRVAFDLADAQWMVAHHAATDTTTKGA